MNNDKGSFQIITNSFNSYNSKLKIDQKETKFIQNLDKIEVEIFEEQVETNSSK